MNQSQWHTLPPLLANWRWETNQITKDVRLLAPNGGWQTRYYPDSNKAIAEAHGA